MKHLCTLFGLLVAFTISAQDTYFTVYNFTVPAENVSSVYSLMDGYFSKNKAEGVTTTLYENHISDSGNNFSHSIVFSGSLDAMGAMYSGAENVKWELFLARVGMQIDEGFGSAMGRVIAAYGDASTPYPVQKYFLLDVEDGGAHTEAYEKYNSEHNPNGRMASMGNITSGHSPDGVNRWVINGFKDFKSALGGAGSLRSDSEKEASREAWDEYRSTNGGVRLVRSGLRIQLGQW